MRARPRRAKIDGRTLATYWFATLVDAIEAGDAILRAEAEGKLRALGFVVRTLQ